jgi:hypothetical protein
LDRLVSDHREITAKAAAEFGSSGQFRGLEAKQLQTCTLRKGFSTLGFGRDEALAKFNNECSGSSRAVVVV